MGDTLQPDQADVAEGSGVVEPDPQVNRIAVGHVMHLFFEIGRRSLVLPFARGDQKGVNDIYISSDPLRSIYAATDSGLLKTSNTGNTWDQIYYSSDIDSRICLSVTRYDHTILLGTRNGLFTKTDQEASWRRIKKGLNNDPVYHIVQNRNFIYLSTGQMLFKLDKHTGEIQKIFSMGIGGKPSDNILFNENSIISEDQLINAIEQAHTIKPERFSILGDNGLHTNAIIDALTITGIIN